MTLPTNKACEMADELERLVHAVGVVHRTHGTYEPGDAVSHALFCRENIRAKVDLANYVLDQWAAILTALRTPASPTREAVEGWQLNDGSAPYACHVLAARFDTVDGEWTLAFVLSPPERWFTHWRMIEPPALKSEPVVDQEAAK